jgi:4-alpha-glucanotransferase
MGLHRLFWIPPGLKATEGIYVRYEAKELYAILCLEAHRQRAVIVGEDLGLVPREVRRTMRRRHIYRSYVAQYEMVTGDGGCPEAAPADSVATLNTHDMHPFAAFWDEEDITERQAVGVLMPEQAVAEKEQRQAGKASLLRCLVTEGRFEEINPTAEEVLRVIAEILAESTSEVMLVNLADLTGERRAQNIPGTYQEHANWRRKIKLSLEELETTPEIQQFLKKIDQIRNKVSNASPKD